MRDSLVTEEEREVLEHRHEVIAADSRLVLQQRQLVAIRAAQIAEGRRNDDHAHVPTHSNTSSSFSLRGVPQPPPCCVPPPVYPSLPTLIGLASREK